MSAPQSSHEPKTLVSAPPPTLPPAHPIGTFDRISAVYDLLAKLTFGGAIQRAQRRLLNDLPRSPRVLLLGGGSGWFLSELCQRVPAAEVISIDASPAMNRRAARRLERLRRQGLNPRVTLITASHAVLDEQPWRDLPPFDLLITPFFLDIFSPEEIPSLMRALSIRLTPEGRWLFADFCPPLRGWRAAVLWVMYRFFRFVARLENQALGDFPTCFRQLGFIPEGAERLGAKMILSASWRRRAPDEDKAHAEPCEATRNESDEHPGG